MPFISTTDKRWTSLLEETSPDFYQLPGFAEIDAELIDGEAMGWYDDEDGTRSLIPLVKRSIGQHDLYDLVSPYGYPGMISNTKLLSEQAALIFHRFHLEAKREAYVSSFLRLNPFSNLWNFNTLDDSIELDFRQVFHGETVSVDLKPSITSIRKKYSENHKRDLLLLAKKGFHSVNNNWELLGEFIEIYHQTMTRRLASKYYFFSKEYFQKLKKILGDRLVFVTITDGDGRLVSGGLFTLFGKIMQYHLGATLTEAMEYSPSKMMMDASISYGNKQGAEILHVGGGFSANSSDGLFRFKKGFGSHLQPFSTLRFVHHSDIYEKLIQDKHRRTEENGYFPEYRNL